MLYITYFLNGFLMIAMPVGLGIYLARHYKIGWRLFWIGAATFISSQILHIPFNLLVNPIFSTFGYISLPLGLQLAISAVFLGLSAGLFEELSRYVMYRWVARDARSWGRGLMAGIGHGGAEAIILGSLVLYAYIQMVALRGTDLSKVVSADQLSAAQAQVTAYWSAPWYRTLLGALERLFTLPMHLACSLLVMQVFTRKQTRWVIFAILLHALADGLAVFAQGMKLSAFMIEGVIGFVAIFSVVIIFLLRTLEPVSPPIEQVIKPVQEFVPKPLDETNDHLDDTRFQ